MAEALTRADFPVGKEVQYRDSGQEGVIVSISEADEEEYESETDVFVEMNGQVVHSDVSKLTGL